MTLKNDQICEAPKQQTSKDPVYYSPILHLITAVVGLKAGLEYGGPSLASVPCQIMLQGIVYGVEVAFISPTINAINHYFEEPANECVAMGDAHQAE